MRKYNKNVLVIEDNEILGKTMIRVLKHFFVKDIDLIVSKDDFKSKKSIENYDFLICNLSTPEKSNALELIEKIKKVNSKIKTVVTTGNPSLEIEKKALEIGIDKFLVKPCRLGDIISIATK